MRLQWRRLRPGELDHELIWLLVSVTAAGFAVLWLRLGLPWPQCTFLAVTGLPCFTCGATRASLAFLQTDFALAWRLNPLVFAGLCTLVLFNLYAAAVLITRAPRLRISSTYRRAARMVAAAAGVTAGANWLYLLTRN